MAYVPNYESVVDAANYTVDTITVENNTVDNFEQNAKDNGVNCVYDVNGYLIGYTTNANQTVYENGEYIERTIQVPLYPHLNENSTTGNIIIDYKPYERYESHDGSVYEDGSATFVVNKNDYAQSALAAAGIEVDMDQVPSEMLDAMWEALADDRLHQYSMTKNPLYEELVGASGIDVSGLMFDCPDTTMMSRLRLSENKLKYLGDEDSLCAVLKAAAAAGFFDVSDIVEDDPETRQYFRFEAQVGDDIILKSPLGANSGNRFDEKWFAAFIRPMLYCEIGYPGHAMPSDADFQGYKIYNTDVLVAQHYDDQVYAGIGKHCNIWVANFQRFVRDGGGYQADTRFYGFYAPQDSPTAKITSIDREHGFANVNFQNIYYPGGQYDWGAMRFGPWYERSSNSYFGVGSANRPPTGGTIVFSFDDFIAYLGEVLATQGLEAFWPMLGAFYIFADCVKASSVPGVKKSDNALRITANSTIAEIKQQIPTQYPNWSNKTIVQNEYNIYNNTSTPVTYYPIGIGQPKDQQTVVQAGTPTKEVIEKNINYNYQYTYNQVPNNPQSLPDDGPTHGLLKSNKFWTVYSPTNSQLDALGNKLWDQTFIDLLKQAFVNPTDGIICLQQIYCSVPLGAWEEICFGRYRTGVDAQIVEDFNLEIDCGIAQVPRFYNDPRDYTETSVNIYLPFIGFRELDAKDVIGKSIRLKYRIDVLTGTCIAYISPRKEEANLNFNTSLTTCSYMFSGNCAVQLPITAADRSRILSGMVGGLGVGGFGGAKVGGAIGSVLGGPYGAFIGGGIGAGIGAGVGMLTGGLSGNQRKVYRSSDIGANAGALSPEHKPYLIIDRQKPYDAYSYPTYYGKPENATIALANCQGYTRIKDVIINTVNASEYEKNLIDRLLKSGIII